MTDGLLVWCLLVPGEARKQAPVGNFGRQTRWRSPFVDPTSSFGATGNSNFEFFKFQMAVAPKRDILE